MTYCVGFCLQDGLVLLSDTRTNAGPDNIANFGKMHVVAPGDRVIAMMTSGNLAVTQAVTARVLEGAGIGAHEPFETLMTVTSMYDAAQLEHFRDFPIRNWDSQTRRTVIRFASLEAMNGEGL